MTRAKWWTVSVVALLLAGVAFGYQVMLARGVAWTYMLVASDGTMGRELTPDEVAHRRRLKAGEQARIRREREAALRELKRESDRVFLIWGSVTLVLLLTSVGAGIIGWRAGARSGASRR